MRNNVAPALGKKPAVNTQRDAARKEMPQTARNIPWVSGMGAVTKTIFSPLMSEEDQQEKERLRMRRERLRYSLRSTPNFDTGMLMSIRVVACECLKIDVLMRHDLDLGFLLADFKAYKTREKKKGLANIFSDGPAPDLPLPQSIPRVPHCASGTRP